MDHQSLSPITWDSLKDFLDRLEEFGELKRISTEVDPKHEIGAICRKLNMIKGPAVLFENVMGSDIPVASQLLASNRRLAIALGVDTMKDFHDIYSQFKKDFPKVHEVE